MAGSLILSGNQFDIAGPPQKKPADRNCRDDSEARREDLVLGRLSSYLC